LGNLSVLTISTTTATPEEVNKLVNEWDMATALEVEREEGFEKGLERAESFPMPFSHNDRLAVKINPQLYQSILIAIRDSILPRFPAGIVTLILPATRTKDEFLPVLMRVSLLRTSPTLTYTHLSPK